MRQPTGAVALHNWFVPPSQAVTIQRSRHRRHDDDSMRNCRATPGCTDVLRAPYLVARLRFVRHDTVSLTDKDDISRGCWTNGTICCAFAPDNLTCVWPEGREIACAVGRSEVV